MSEFFIRTFKREHKCGHCPKRAFRRGDRTYSLCPRHLVTAREKWANWAVRRRSEAKCCYCHRKSYNGWLRCRFHTLVNRENCRAWQEENYEEKRAKEHERWLKAAKMLKLFGICPACKVRKVEGDFKRCAPCRKRQQEIKANSGRVVVGGIPVRGRGLGA